MKTYPTVPYQLVDGWPSSVETHAAGEKVSLQYHEVEEWLEVLDGESTFASAGGQKHLVRKGEVLNIPQGELHNVKVGPNGVQYRLWTPVPKRDEIFRKELNPVELELVRKNLDLPEAENRKDANPSDTAFLSDFVSNDLIFRSAGGEVLSGKKAFMERLPSQMTRSSSGSIRVLHKGAGSLLISTTVHTTPKEGGQAKSFVNLRLFRKENSGWQCLVWMNYIDAGTSPTEAPRTAEQDLELWKHHATFGGEDKNRMVTIASWLLGASAAVFWYLVTTCIDLKQFQLTEPGRVFVLALMGLGIAGVAGYLSLLYGGYSNRNWEIADQIAHNRGWKNLLPSADESPSRSLGLNAIARRWARPCRPEKELAPVFVIYLCFAMFLLAVHLLILGWSL